MPNIPSLPFEYRARQRHIPWDSREDAVRVMEQRDRELEDFLGANFPIPAGTGSGAGPYVKVGGLWTTGNGWEFANGFDTDDPTEAVYAVAASGSAPNKAITVTIFQPGAYLMTMLQDIWRTSTGGAGVYESGFGLPGNFSSTGYLTYCATQGNMIAGQDYWYGTESTVELLNPTPALTAGFRAPGRVFGTGDPTESTALLSIVRLADLYNPPA